MPEEKVNEGLGGLRNKNGLFDKNGRMILQEGTRPCGSEFLHSSTAASELVILLDQLENILTQDLPNFLAD